MDKLLNSFSASFAKWRYETLFVVVEALLPLRELCQKHLREELFQNIQDRAALQAAVDASRDARFWVWMATMFEHVLTPLETIRRWGMCCPHQRCLDMRRAGKTHIYCHRNSRRMKGAWHEIETWINHLTDKANNLTEADCEGSNTAWRVTTHAMHTVATLLRKRFQYLSMVPWCVVQADSQPGAEEVIHQWRSRPPEDHDPVMVDIMSRLEAAIVVVAEGGVPSQALLDQIRVMAHTPLDESAGEGYHRGTNHEKVRAPNSGTAHLKQDVRAKSVIRDVRQFVRTYHGLGRAVLRFEMTHWQRIVQTDPSKRWTRRRMHPKLIMERVPRR